MQLRLKKFDISSIADNSIIVLLGKRNTGKSFLVRDVLWHHQDLPVATVISPTEAANAFYSTIVPSLFIHDKVTPELLAGVIKRQKMVKRRYNREKAIHGSSTVDARAAVILDDCLYDKSWAQDESMRYLFMNGRHVNAFVMITMQHPMGIPPNLRTNIDYTFILRENNHSNRRRIYENYAGMFPNLDVFCQVMDQATNGYDCLVIANAARSNKLDEQVFWYCANDHEQFRIGAPEFWQVHKDLCEESEDEEEMLDVSKMRNRRGPSINVKMFP